jgi:hypothetical protein
MRGTTARRQVRRIGKRAAASCQNPLIQINAKRAALPNMAPGNGPDAVHFPNILK